LVQQGSEGVDQLYGYAEADTLNGLGGDDTLYGANGNDTLSGGDGKDRIYGQNDDDIINGDAGNDTLFGDDGNDVLDGGDGDDWISGGKGDDILRGGAGGNDFLRGDAGNDTYLFGTGDGMDTIYNNDSDVATTDVARFENASIEDLWFSRNGNNLEITVAGTDDRMTFSNWYGNTGNQLDRIEASSSVLLNSQVEQLVSAMASYDVPSGVGNVIPQDVKDTLQPVLTTTWQAV
jgi:Ca2+-binding RTX toxin-like protein